MFGRKFVALCSLALATLTGSAVLARPAQAAPPAPFFCQNVICEGGDVCGYYFGCYCILDGNGNCDEGDCEPE